MRFWIDDDDDDDDIEDEKQENWQELLAGKMLKTRTILLSGEIRKGLAEKTMPFARLRQYGAHAPGTLPGQFQYPNR